MYLKHLLRLHRILRDPNPEDVDPALSGKTAEEIAAEEAAAAAAAAKQKPTDNEAKLLKESMQRKAQLEELKKKYEGVDPEEFKRLKDEAAARKQAEEKAELDKAEKAGEFERVKKSLLDQHEKEKLDLQKKLDDLIKQKDAVANANHELTIGRAFSDAPFITDELVYTPSATRSLKGAHFELVDGKVVGYDKPRGASDRTPLVDAKGEALPFADALKKIIDADPEADRWYKAKITPGAGGKGNQHKPGLVEVGSGLSRISAGLKKLNQ